MLAHVRVELTIKQPSCHLRKESENSCDHIRVRTLKDEEKSVILTGHCWLASNPPKKWELTLICKQNMFLRSTRACRDIIFQEKTKQKKTQKKPSGCENRT